VKVALLAVGSRGDVQPYIALGVGLRTAGHDVRLVTTEEFASLAGEHALPVDPVPFSVQAALAERSARRAVEGGGHLASFRAFKRIARTGAVAFARTALEATRDVGVMVGGLSALAVGRGISTRSGVPFLPALNVPVDVTTAWPGALFPHLRIGPRRLSRLASHRLTRLALGATLRAGADAARTEVLGLPPLRRLAGLGTLLPRSAHVLYGISSTILPPPDDWPPTRHVVGTWFLGAPTDWRPNPDLEAFLAAGPAPIYVGFGSMGTDDPSAAAKVVLDAIRASGVRAVVHRGWARLLPDAPSDAVHVVEGVPHTWLLPRVAAAVHHGGAGTTAASLRAGVPTAVVPFHGDQRFWGWRVQQLGAGPDPIPRARLSAERLASALVQATSDAALRRRAEEVGSSIRSEDGARDAVAWIEERVART
jgi:UDP:flavonoid glycosyltransferase YjiC (YdhE family)